MFYLSELAVNSLKAADIKHLAFSQQLKKGLPTSHKLTTQTAELRKAPRSSYERGKTTKTLKY
jgi:hypothetical protein